MATQDLKFVPFRSDLELGFYTNVFQTKLEHAKLDDSARPLMGLYTPAANKGGAGAADPALSARMLVNSNALTAQQVPAEHVRADGFLKNVNTMEDFRAADKSALIRNAARQTWEAINDGTIYQCPSLLSLFFVLSFADLKQHRFTYWAAYPALHSEPAWRRVGDVGRFSLQLSTDLVEKVGTFRYMSDERKRGFFLAKLVRGPVDEHGRGAPSPSTGEDLNSRPSPTAENELEWVVAELAEFERGFFDGVPDKRRYVCFVDSSGHQDSPSWPLRNLLVLVRRRFRMSKVKILCYRDNHAQRHAARSIVLDLESDGIDPRTETSEMPKVTGWERNSQHKLSFRQVNLRDYMDPKSIADAAIDLNLKLMKWRLAPDLDLDAIKNTKCLLLGAGTLGGYVSRGLLAWGVRHITFVDYGNVSYSNPVRQPLFAFDHCANGGEPKAARAAASLREIYPGVVAEGHAMEVPMLGHPLTDEPKTRASFEKLQQLVADHDAVFLLMDTRESRWLPSVMGKAHGKIVLNAALGFDTYVAMRHGAELEDKKATTLGCYFCNDIVAPADSMKDATLDQQCTVTRPGVASMASAALVEMLASILQHPRREFAPAPTASTTAGNPPERDPPSHPLGLVPHQIRGYLSYFQTQLIRGESYPCCSACSPPVLEAYRADGWEFVRRALADKQYVLELSGLAEVQRRAEELAADVEWSEGEDDGEAELL